MSTETQEPFGSRKRDWSLAFSWVKAFLVLFAAALVTVIAFAAKTYVRDEAAEQTATAVVPFIPIPSKVQSLEEFRIRQETNQAAVQLQVQQIFVKLSAIETKQDEATRTNDRILRTIERQQNTTR